jgi:hypothetical protein
MPLPDTRIGGSDVRRGCIHGDLVDRTGAPDTRTSTHQLVSKVVGHLQRAGE